MKNKKEREFKHEICLRIGKILDSLREHDGLSSEEEEELHYLRNLLETKCVPEKRSMYLPFTFDFDRFTAKQYQELRESGYTVEEIQEMCHVSKRKFYLWCVENDLLEKKKESQGIDLRNYKK
jgi:hypothetical protein